MRKRLDRGVVRDISSPPETSVVRCWIKMKLSSAVSHPLGVSRLAKVPQVLRVTTTDATSPLLVALSSDWLQPPEAR